MKIKFKKRTGSGLSKHSATSTQRFSKEKTREPPNTGWHPQLQKSSLAEGKAGLS
jgi:hypothetical protein